MQGEDYSGRSRLVALVLCWLLGIFGAHRFYAGKIGTGILMIVTLGGLTIWAFVDLVVILLGAFTDREGRRVWRWVEKGSI